MKFFVVSWLQWDWSYSWKIFVTHGKSHKHLKYMKESSDNKSEEKWSPLKFIMFCTPTGHCFGYRGMMFWIHLVTRMRHILLNCGYFISITIHKLRNCPKQHIYFLEKSPCQIYNIVHGMNILNEICQYNMPILFAIRRINLGIVP